MRSLPQIDSAILARGPSQSMTLGLAHSNAGPNEMAVLMGHQHNHQARGGGGWAGIAAERYPAIQV